MFRQIYYNFCYYSFLTIFAIGVWLINILCVLVTPFLSKEKSTQFLTELVYLWVKIYVELTSASGCLITNYSILDSLNHKNKGALIIANHPSILDAPLFLGSIRGLRCVFKSSLKRSLILPKTAKTLNYLSNKDGLDMLKDLIHKLELGEQFLIFPEGTRSENGYLNPFNTGYALAALRARVPIHLVCIRTHSPILGKRQHFLKPSKFPVTFLLDLGPTIEPDNFSTVKHLNLFIEDWFKKQLQSPSPSPRSFLPPSTQLVTADFDFIQVVLKVPEQPFYCEGHMPENPIVPGFVQIIWMKELFARFARSTVNPMEYSRWKFLKPILPKDQLSITLQATETNWRVLIERNGLKITQGRMRSA